jgi:hypothetical protein
MAAASDSIFSMHYPVQQEVEDGPVVSLTGHLAVLDCASSRSLLFTRTKLGLVAQALRRCGHFGSGLIFAIQCVPPI